MFERYTEKARRVIFFARYEASQFGSPYIESEHLLLGLLREDKALTNRLFKDYAEVETIRDQIEQQVVRREKVSTSVDLPLADDAKHILAYAAKEATRLAHLHIGTEHVLLGILREEGCFAARLLTQRGLQLAELRLTLQHHNAQSALTPSTPETRSRQQAGAHRCPVVFRLLDSHPDHFLLRVEDSLSIPAIGESISIPGMEGKDRLFRVLDVTWRFHSGPDISEKPDGPHLREVIITMRPEDPK